MAPQWTRGAGARSVGLAVALVGCSVVTGLDDKVFDLGAGGGSGGVGGAAGGQGGTGVAGAGPCAVESLAVEPQVIYVADQVGRPYAVAAAPGHFAVVALVPGSPPARVVSVLTTEGAAEVEDSYYVLSAGFEAHVTAGHDRFALVVPYESGGQLQLRMRDTAGLALPTTTITGTGNPTQAHALAVDDGFLVTHATTSDDFYFTLVSAPTWSPGTVTAFSPATVCDDGRAWAAARLGATVAVAWQSTCAAGQWELALYTTQTGMTPAAALSPMNGAPRFGGSLGAGFFFANCGQLAHVGVDGELLASAVLPATNCAIGSHDTGLRMIDPGVPGKLRWRALDTSGALTELFEIDGTLDGPPSVAWDGSGYAIVWWEGGEIRYARVCVPPD